MTSDSGIGGLSEKIGDANQSGLDILTKFREANLYSRAKYIPLRPLNALSDEGPYQFMIGGRKNPDVVMLNSMRLTVKFKVVKIDGTDLSANETISIVNTPVHSLFENIGCKLNDIPISDHARMYHYKAFIQQMYSYSNEVKKHNLECEYFLKDAITTDTSPTIPTDLADTTPLAVRKGWIVGSKPIHATIVPYIDIMSTPHFLCPGHDLFLEFERSRSSFSLLAANDSYKIKMLDMVLWVRVLEPLPSIINSLEKYKNSGLVQYPITRNVIRTHQIHSGTSRIEINNIFRDRLPRALYVFFLENAQIVGSISKNPFIFKHYNVMEAHITINGFPYPSEPIRSDFSAGRIDSMNAFRWFLDNVGILDNDCDIGITAEEFRSNLFMIPFDLSPRGVSIF